MASILPDQEDMGVGWMHVYPQERPHGPALIRGNRRSLEKLKDAIERVLAGDQCSSAEVYARDGEHYKVEVERASVLAQVGHPFYLSRLTNGR